jgi:AraC-like DNA-binding protein
VGKSLGISQRDPKAYTVAEVAELTGFSRQAVARMFEKEKGVLILERPKSAHKRGYRSIRIGCTAHFPVTLG